MARLVRYGSYLRELGSQQRWVGFRSPGDTPRWLRLLRGPGTALLSLTAILALFEMLILRESPAGGWQVAGGLAVLLLGVVLLREGLRGGLVPFCDAFARALAVRSPLAVVIGASFVLGLLIPFVEPIFGALIAGSAHLDARTDPYLHALLRQHPGTLLAVLMAGTGSAVALGILRIVRGWSLRPLIVVTLVPALGLTGQLLFDPELSRVPALAWDCAALIGGPATAILALAFGNGTAAAAGSNRVPLPGFGVAALATIVPALAVLVYAMILAETTDSSDVIAAAAATARPGHPAWVLLFGVPLMLGTLLGALYLPLRFLLEGTLPRPRSLILHLALCLVGLSLVSVGVRHGLGPMIDQAGAGLANLLVKPPAAATEWPAIADLMLAAAFVAAAAWQAARAEPALAVFSELVETATHGVLREARLTRTIAVGAAIGTFIGVLAIASGFPIPWLIIPGWLMALLLAAVAGEDIAVAAWDGAAVMTGPLTITVLAGAAVGLGRVPWVNDGFGLVAASLLGGALAVLVRGAAARLSSYRRTLLRNAGFAIP